MFRAIEGILPANSPAINQRFSAGVYDIPTSLKAGHMDITKPKRIMVVDDDHTILEVLDHFLSALDFDVQTVDNPYNALDLFKNEKFELVLSDIQMPGMDGWELSSNFKTISPETPVVLITGMDKHEVEARMKNGPADTVLYKPFNLKTLTTVVNGFLAD